MRFVNTDWVVGDLVTINDEWKHRAQANVIGKKFRVTKINPKNTVAEPFPADGSRGIAYPHESLRLTTENEVLSSSTFVPFVEREIFNAGELVVVKNGYPGFGWTERTPVVVIRQNEKRVSVVDLGGSPDGRYLNVPPAGLRRITTDDLLELLTVED